MDVCARQFQKRLAERVFRQVFRENDLVEGHVHFHVSGHLDHLILLCSRCQLGRVITKSPHCAKWECRPWHRSSFSVFDREQVLREVSRDIAQVRIDVGDCEMTWPGLDDFLHWLEHDGELGARLDRAESALNSGSPAGAGEDRRGT